MDKKLKMIFDNEKYNIPISFKSDDFKAEVEKLLSEYIQDLREVNVSEETIDKVLGFEEFSLKTLDYYFKGLHFEAYNNFENAVRVLEISESSIIKSQIKIEEMYRARENKNGNSYSEDEMFHIPLNKRGKVKTQRYSFPGLPCLYLSASVYTCWVEMKCPLFENFQVALIRPTPAIDGQYIYDLTNIPQRLNDISKYDNLKEDYFLYWPLVALCSIKVKNESDDFKPEYIFSQFLLEMIIKNKARNEVVGIKYVSTKVASICKKQLEDDWHTYVNYAFPVRSESTLDKQCNVLKGSFEISSNYSGRDLQILTRLFEQNNIMKDNSKVQGSDTGVKEWRVFTKDTKNYGYNLSVFGLIQDVLKYYDGERDGFINNETIDYNSKLIGNAITGNLKDDKFISDDTPVNPINKDQGNGWDNSTGKWRWLINNKPVKDEWRCANGNWFYLGEDGNMVKNSLIENESIGSLAYVDKYGAMVTDSWKAVDLDDEAKGSDAEYRWMYFGHDGKAYKSNVEGKFVINDINSKKYAFDAKGLMLYGWIKKDSSRLLDSDPYAWKTADYYFGEWNDGSMSIGDRVVTVQDENGVKRKYCFKFDDKGIKREYFELT